MLNNSQIFSYHHNVKTCLLWLVLFDYIFIFLVILKIAYAIFYLFLPL